MNSSAMKLKDASHIYASFFLSHGGFEKQVREACEMYDLVALYEKIIQMLWPHRAVVNMTGHSTATHAICHPQGDYQEIITINEAVRRIRFWIDNGEI